MINTAAVQLLFGTAVDLGGGVSVSPMTALFGSFPDPVVTYYDPALAYEGSKDFCMMPENITEHRVHDSVNFLDLLENNAPPY